MAHKAYPRNAAETIRAALDAELDTDSVLIEHYDPTEIENISLAEIELRLAELGETPSMPAVLKKAIVDSAAPAAHLLNLLTDAQVLTSANIKDMPLPIVKKHLQRLGINYQTGLAEIIDFTEEQAKLLGAVEEALPAEFDPMRNSAAARSWQTNDWNDAALKEEVDPKEWSSALWHKSLTLIGSIVFPNRLMMAAVSSACIAFVALIAVLTAGEQYSKRPVIRADHSPIIKMMMAPIDKMVVKADKMVVKAGPAEPMYESRDAAAEPRASASTDLAAPEGTPVRAADDGVVVYAGNEFVLVRHANGFVTAYANASELMVKRNDRVHKGQVIAKSGQTGPGQVVAKSGQTGPGQVIAKSGQTGPGPVDIAKAPF
jgi:hypothetical protein